jgi:hypothetical protein
VVWLIELPIELLDGLDMELPIALLGAMVLGFIASGVMASGFMASGFIASGDFIASLDMALDVPLVMVLVMPLLMLDWASAAGPMRMKAQAAAEKKRDIWVNSCCGGAGSLPVASLCAIAGAGR